MKIHILCSVIIVAVTRVMKVARVETVDQSEWSISGVEVFLDGICSTGPVLMSLRPGVKDLQPYHITSPDEQLCTQHLHDIIIDTSEWTEDDTQSQDWISTDVNWTKPSRRETELHESSVRSISEVRGHDTNSFSTESNRRTLKVAAH